MAVKFARSSLVSCLVTTSVLAIATAQWSWGGQNDYCWRPCWDKNNTKKEIVVGGSDWHFGFNYSDWAMKSGPFYISDILVFKYDSPSDPNWAHNHSVYLLKDFQSYQNCSLEGAIELADPYGGSKGGFKLELKFGFPYFIVCGEKNGLHCNLGLMKFIAWPFFHPYSSVEP